jgi:hypothetical protein
MSQLILQENSVDFLSQKNQQDELNFRYFLNQKVNFALNSEETLVLIAKQIVRALENNDRSLAVAMLRQLTTKSSEFSPAYLLQVANALETDNWDELGDDFIEHNFIGQNGYILIVGPYTRMREDQKVVKLTAIFGRIESTPLLIPNLEAAAQEAFGELLQPLAPTFPIENIAACGNIGQEEAFLAPDCWCFPESEHGPALVNMTAHQQRFTGWIESRIRCIFEPKTADLILQLLEDKSMQIQEYWLHEAGHAAGMGLKMKIANNLLPNPDQRAWEEYKTDIAGFYLAASVLTPEQVGRLVAATLCIRFGIDAHRPGDPDQDHDAMSALLLFDRLLFSGQVQVLENDQLRLLDVSYEGLYKATIPHRLEANCLIQEELGAIDNPEKIVEFYSWQDYHPETRALFDRLVESCR